MAVGDKNFEDKLRRVTDAWERMRPSKTFGGMTLAQFKAKTAASEATRQAVRAAQETLANALNARNGADATSNVEMLKVVKGVVGDPDETDDGDLYEAMGYVRKSERKTGLVRAKKADAPRPV